MSYNDIPEGFRSAIIGQLAYDSEEETAAGILLELIDDSNSYDKDLSGAISEIMEVAQLEFDIDDGEVVISG